MIAKERATLSALIHRFDKEGKADLSHYIKQENVIIESAKPEFRSLLSAFAWLEEIHYSWIEKAVDSLPKRFFFHFLGEREKRRLKIGQEKSEVSPFLLPFLAALLKKRIVPEDILPIEQLPPSPLSGLFSLSKERIVRLIDLLGLYDLAIELRSIVEKKRLDKIYALFSKDERNLLSYFSQQSIKWVPPKLGLEKWDEEKESLFRMLHQRGLIRFGKALAQEDKSFLWHITHKLDVGRGEMILKWVSSDSEKELIPYFKGQVIDLLKRFSP